MSDEINVEVITLELLDVEPSLVTGDRAFVLFHPEVGQIEIGDPLPEDEIWSHFSGDLVYVAVHELSGGVTSGGGDSWGSDRIGALWSEPTPDSEESAWVVLYRIPNEYNKVILDHNKRRFGQAVVERAAVFPLNNSGGPSFSVSGIDSQGNEQLLFDSDGLHEVDQNRFT